MEKDPEAPYTFTIYGRRLCVRINRGPCPLWPNGWMDQDATWYGGRPRPKRHCVRWGLSSPYKGQSLPIFGPCGQTADWITMPLGMEVGLCPGHIVLCGPSSPSQKGHIKSSITFRPMSVVAKRSPILATAELLLSLSSVRCLFDSFGTGNIHRLTSV